MIATTALSSSNHSRIQVLRVVKNGPVYIEGDDAMHWYAVAEGIVRSCRFDADGNRQVIGLHFAGDVFGMDAGVRLDTAEAVIDAKVWCLPHEPDAEVTAAHFGKALWKALSRVRDTQTLLGRRSADERLGAFLLMLMRRTDEQEGFDIPMNRHDIADYLGLCYHTVSRTMIQLCKEGLIEMEGPSRCRIIGLERLQTLAGE